jgi:hypothetical protein
MFETLQPAGYGIASVFFVISTATILLRVYSRGFVVKSIGLDDWCMFAIGVGPTFCYMLSSFPDKTSSLI